MEKGYDMMDLQKELGTPLEMGEGVSGGLERLVTNHLLAVNSAALFQTDTSE